MVSIKTYYQIVLDMW